MRIIRFSYLNSSDKILGILEEKEIFELMGDPLNYPIKGRYLGNLSDVKLWSPCVPSKIICVAINFERVEGFSKTMSEPLVFVKPPTCAANPGDTIINPFPQLPWWGEAELGVVIKNKLKDADESTIREGILGFTIGNDTTVENVEHRDHHLARSKCADSFCSFGPWIDTDFDASDCLIEAIQNGEIIRSARSSEQFWQWPKIVSWLSTWMTLEPYDLVLTGNPPDTVGMRFLEEGDTYCAKVHGLGELTNKFILKK
jgi:2-keto-4-pentenoate hydratase/2-oxohepta-3-ene-1,7-dioic acid hydratase in catechol pathway